MGVVSYDFEITTPVPLAKMFKAVVLDSDNLIPKVLPQAIKSVEVLKGNGGPGTIKLITFSEVIMCLIPIERNQAMSKSIVLDCGRNNLNGPIDAIKIVACDVETGSQYKTMKHKVEALDKENFTYSYSVIKGDVLGTTFEKISYEAKITASPEGGSVCKNTSKYFTIGEVDTTEEKIKAGKEKASAMFKAIEAYLLANPDAY